MGVSLHRDILIEAFPCMVVPERRCHLIPEKTVHISATRGAPEVVIVQFVVYVSAQTSIQPRTNLCTIENCNVRWFGVF